MLGRALRPVPSLAEFFLFYALALAVLAVVVVRGTDGAGLDRRGRSKAVMMAFAAAEIQSQVVPGFDETDGSPHLLSQMRTRSMG
ncbi:hypothetical protein QN219_21655 [Sinorhizobium sp. 7-81]|uniref:hypothetical protein n=1 Tax=Sinorhizobium sp. 8-89 TaxID=3049089 RepID=UPI0024C24BE8|nr:hypothetical protein [Sinorhizobium sp. 8-89]MDK1492637.1 hypothetical protein [Sinorhizobium sp. 8-89]